MHQYPKHRDGSNRHYPDFHQLLRSVQGYTVLHQSGIQLLACGFRARDMSHTPVCILQHSLPTCWIRGPAIQEWCHGLLSQPFLSELQCIVDDHARSRGGKPAAALLAEGAWAIAGWPAFVTVDPIHLPGALPSSDRLSSLLCTVCTVAYHAVYKRSKCWVDERPQTWLASYWDDICSEPYAVLGGHLQQDIGWSREPHLVSTVGQKQQESVHGFQK